MHGQAWSVLLKKSLPSCSHDIAELMVKPESASTLHVAYSMPELMAIADLVLELPRSFSNVFPGPTSALCVCS